MLKNLINRCVGLCDKIFLSIPLSIALILFVCVICLVGVSTVSIHIFQSAWFLFSLSYLVFMMLYCSARRVPALFGLYSARREVPRRGGDTKTIFSFNISGENRKKIVDLFEEILFGKRYKKTIASGGNADGGSLLFEKSKIGVFGAHLLHFGIAVLLVAGIITSKAGIFYDRNIKEGEVVKLEGTETSIKLEKFSVIPSNKKEIAEEYFSRLRVNRPSAPVEWHTLKVNAPLRVDGFRLYQMRFNYDLEKLDIALFGQSGIKLINIVPTEVNERVILKDPDIGIEVTDFVPNFIIDAKGNVTSRSYSPENPACYARIYSPGSSEKVIQEGWVFRDSGTSHDVDNGQQWKMRINKLRIRNTSGIKFTKNPAEYITYLGLILLVAGSFLSCYKFYRCVIVSFYADGGTEGLTVKCSIQKTKNMVEFEREMNKVKEKFQKFMLV